MNSLSANHYIRVGFAVLLIAAISFFLVFTLTPNGVATSPDSLAYICAAKNIAHGGSLSIPDFKLMTDAYEKPMTAWPPLYSEVLSWAITDNHSEESIRLINGIMLFLLSLFFMLNLIRPHLLLGVIGALVLLLQGAIITVYSYAWSETLFLPLLVSAYFFGVAYCNSGDRKQLYLTLMLIILAGYTRYIGIVFLLPLVMMIWLSSLAYREKIVSAIVVGVGASLAFIPLIIRNITAVGIIGGEPREESTSHFLNNIADVGDLLSYHLLGLWHGYIFLCIAILIGVIIVFFKKNNNSEKVNSVMMIVWPLCWAICYLGAIIVLRTWKNFDVLDTRLVSPAIVFFLLSIFQLINVILNNAKWKWLLIPMSVWGVWLILHGVGIYSMALSNWHTQASPAYQMNEHTQYGNFTAHPGSLWMPQIYKQVQELTKNLDPVIIVDGSQSMVFKHLTNAKVKELPFSLDPTIIDKINQRGIGALVITTPVGVATLKAYYGANIGSLSALPELLQYNIVVIALPLPKITHQ